ncbi:pentatricopeptide repeat-containing protein DOT4, chloroplastic [Tanacetum coccineum]
MIAWYFKCGNVDSARKMFGGLCERDVVSWNSMISGYVACGLAEKGFRVFVEMICDEVTVDLTTMVNVVVACANMCDVKLGRSVHGLCGEGGLVRKCSLGILYCDMFSNVVIWMLHASYLRIWMKKCCLWTSLLLDMQEKGLSDEGDGFVVDRSRNYIRDNQIESLAVSNALMDMYAKCGNMDESYSVFSEMPFRDIVSWNTMIGGFSKNCLPSEALDLFIEMQGEVKPDHINTSSMPLLTCYAIVGLGHEAISTFKQMRDQGINPNEASFTSILYACGHSGLFQEYGKLSLKRIVYYTISAKIKPDATIWGALLCGCRFHRDVQLAEKVAERIFE